MEFFYDIARYAYLHNALAACILSGIACGIMGTYVVCRRTVFLAGGITHASFGGLGIAFYLGLNPIAGALVFAVLSALGIEWAGNRGRIREDSAIGIIWSVGMAVGATAVLVPEEMFDFEAHVAEKIRRARLGGKTNFMIVVAEGAASAVEVGRQIQEELGLDPRVTILGHIQRGGSPTAKDRVMATRMGYEAVHLLAAGKTNRVVCARGDSIVDVDINDGLAMHKTLNSEEYEVMEAMTGI